MKTMILMLSLVGISYCTASAQDNANTTRKQVRQEEREQRVYNNGRIEQQPSAHPNTVDASKNNYPDNAPDMDNKNLNKNDLIDKGRPETNINGTPGSRNTVKNAAPTK